MPTGRVRAYGTFLMQMWGYLQAFELPYDDRDQARKRLRVYYPIRIDRRLGGGVLPGARLQAIRHTTLRDAVDRALGVVYFLWVPERHAAMLWILFRRPREFAHSALLVSTTFDLAWCIYTALPTAPPWWAAKHGRIPEPIERLTLEAGSQLPLAPRQSEDEANAANPWASMPSTHVASAIMIAHVLSDQDSRAGAAASSYAAALSLAVVYLGEHYVADVLAAALLVETIRRIDAAVARFV
jgi:hypothetical protein